MLVLPGTTSVVTVVVNTLVPFGPSFVVSTVVVVGTGDSVVAGEVLVMPVVPNEPVCVVVVDEGIGAVNEAERLASGCQWVRRKMRGTSEAPTQGAKPVITSATRNSITCTGDTQRPFAILKTSLSPLIYDANVEVLIATVAVTACRRRIAGFLGCAADHARVNETRGL